MQTSTVWADVDGSAEMNYDLGPNLPLPKLSNLQEEEEQTIEPLDPAAKAFLSKIPNHGPPYKIMLVGLPLSLTKSDLVTFLSEHQIPNTKLDFTPSQGYCFMTFSSRNACASCVNLKNKRIQGKVLSMKLSGSAQQAELRKQNRSTATGMKGGDQRFKSLRQGDSMRNKPRRPNQKHNHPVGGSIRKARGKTKSRAHNVAPVHNGPRTNPWERSRRNDRQDEKVTIMSRTGSRPIQQANVSSNSRFSRNDDASSPRNNGVLPPRRDDNRGRSGDNRQGSDFRRDRDNRNFRATDFKRNEEGRAETSMSWRRGPTAARTETTRIYSQTSQPPKPKISKETPPESQRQNSNRNPFDLLDQD